jgi:hypothetical protein
MQSQIFSGVKLEQRIVCTLYSECTECNVTLILYNIVQTLEKRKTIFPQILIPKVNIERLKKMNPRTVKRNF